MKPDLTTHGSSSSQLTTDKTCERPRSTVSSFLVLLETFPARVQRVCDGAIYPPDYATCTKLSLSEAVETCTADTEHQA